jgi:hypothetical protein
MRRILVENARCKKAQKRGGARKRVDLADADVHSSPEGLQVLDDALSHLAKEDAEAAEVSLHGPVSRGGIAGAGHLACNRFPALDLRSAQFRIAISGWPGQLDAPVLSLAVCAE